MGTAGAQDGDDAMMDVDDEPAPGARKGKAAKKGKVSEEFKEMVMRVLVDSGYEEQRAAKMNQDQFLALLAAFNKAGIHFV